MDIEVNDIGEVANLITENYKDVPIIAISAPTGTGKSTIVPRDLANTLIVDSNSESTRGARVFVSLGTVVSINSLKRAQTYLQKEAKTNLPIGTAAERKIKYDSSSRIVYATSGHLANVLLNFFQEGVCLNPKNIGDYLVLDEMHTGSLQNRIILSLWKLCYDSVRDFKMPKLILTSATINKSMFDSIDMDIPTITVRTISKPVQVNYTYFNYLTNGRVDTTHPEYEAIMRGIIKQEGKEYGITATNLYREIAQKVLTYHFTFQNHDDKNYKNDTDPFIVILPGKGEIKLVRNHLTVLLTKNPSVNMEILEAYSNLSEEETDKIFLPTAKGYRKVVLGTNVLEDAITIPRAVLVIDSMLEKVAYKSGESTLLKTSNISKASADQRKGRTGRDRPGLVLRMTREENYNGTYKKKVGEEEVELPIFKDHRLEEMLRSTLFMEILKLRSHGIEPTDVFGRVAGNLDMKRVIKSRMVLLRTLGMINSNSQVTEKGNFAAGVELSVRNSALLWDWITKTQQLVFPAIVILSIMDVYNQSFFRVPNVLPQGVLDKDGNPYSTLKDFQDHILANNIKEYRGISDLHTFSKLWSDVMYEIEGGYVGKRWLPTSREVLYGKDKQATNNLKSVCIRKYLNFNMMKTLLQKVSVVYNSLSRLQKQMNPILLDRDIEPVPFGIDSHIEILIDLMKNTHQDLEYVRAVNGNGYTPLINPKKKTYQLSTRNINEIQALPRNYSIYAISIVSDKFLNFVVNGREINMEKETKSQSKILIKPAKIGTRSNKTKTLKNLFQALSKGRKSKKLDPGYSPDQFIYEELFNIRDNISAVDLNLGITQVSIWSMNFHIRQRYINNIMTDTIRNGYKINEDMRKIRSTSKTRNYSSDKQIKTLQRWDSRSNFMMNVEFLTMALDFDEDDLSAPDFPSFKPANILLTGCSEYFSLIACLNLFTNNSSGVHCNFYCFGVEPNEEIGSIPIYEKGIKHNVAYFGKEVDQSWADKFAYLARQSEENSEAPKFLYIAMDNYQDDPEYIRRQKGSKIDIEEDAMETCKDADRIICLIDYIRPTAVSARLRLPYTSGESTNFIKGMEYLQPWSNPTSSAIRIVSSRPYKNKTYDHDRYGNLLYHHNLIDRTNYYEHDYLYKEVEGLCHCYDCSSEIFILGRYFRKFIPLYIQTEGIKNITINISKNITDILSNQKGYEGMTLKIV